MHPAEKIFFCVDVSSSMGDDFGIQKHNKVCKSKMYWIQSCLRIFSHSKAGMCRHHSFALCQLGNEVSELLTPTQDVKKFIRIVNNMYPNHLNNDNTGFTDINSMYPILSKYIHDEHEWNPADSFIIRVILLYSRSNTISPPNEKMEKLLCAPWFFFDAIYIHQPKIQHELQVDEKFQIGNSIVINAPNNEHNGCKGIVCSDLDPVTGDYAITLPPFKKKISMPSKNFRKDGIEQEVYDSITRWDHPQKSKGFFFEISTKIARIFCINATLLVHPFQRGPQEKWDLLHSRVK